MISKGENLDDRVYLPGDLADPLTLAGCPHRGDLLTVGDSTVLIGNKGELQEYLLSNLESLERVFSRVAEIIAPCERPGMEGLDEYLCHTVSMKQQWLREYPPLLFGEKSLYRKGVKLMERRDFSGAREIFKTYFKQFGNSPLARPTKLFYAICSLYNRKIDLAMKTALEILNESDDLISSVTRRLFDHIGLFESAHKLLSGGPDYDGGLYRSMKNALREKFFRASGETILFQEGEVSDKVLVLLEGSLKILKRNKKKQFLLFSLTAPDTIGEIQAAAKCAWDITVVAGENAKFASLNYVEFLRYLFEHVPEEGLRLLEYLLDYSRESQGL